MPSDITLPLNGFAVALYGDERFESIRPTSPAVGDTAKVLVRPYSIGKLLQEADPLENYFHVEIIVESDPLRAEIWLAHEWKESNAYRNRFRQTCATSRAEHDKSKTRVGELITIMRKGALNASPDAYLRELAHTILDNYQSKDFSQIFQAINIAETLSRYAEEDKEGTTAK